MSGKKSEAAKKRKALERRVAKAAEDNKVNEMTFAKLQRAYSKAEAQETSLLADQTRISDTIAELVRDKHVIAAEYMIVGYTLNLLSKGVR